MDPTKPVGVDDHQYRNCVLLLPSEEAEIALGNKLIEEARQLGLKAPEIEVTASLTASIASGMVDLSSPVLSSGSSTDRNSVCEIAQSPEPLPLDQVASSLSELNISDRVKPRSTRSIASLSTRPTSFSSSEGKFGLGYDGLGLKERKASHRNSLLSVTSTEKKEKRRSSLKHAIGKIPFRRKRTPSAVLLPPAAQITVTKGDSGVDKVYVESKSNDSQSTSIPEDEDQVLRLEIPVFDTESLQRSLNDPELNRMHESHKMERNRFVAFQDALLNGLRCKQQTAVSEKLSDNKQLEDEKREKNTVDASRMEERQLAIEIDQQRDFERAKVNSRTRIKYMEGYFRNSSPPPASSESTSGSEATTPPARRFTSQNKAQLAQQYHDHDSMDQLHESKIKVLRDRQELKLQEAIARMERELNDLIDKHSVEFNELQREHRKEEQTVLHNLDAKKTKMRHRWNLEEAILRKKLEQQYGQPYGPLPPISFTDHHYETRDSAICVSENPGASGDEEQMQHKRP